MKTSLDWLLGFVRSGLDRARAGLNRAQLLAVSAWRTGRDGAVAGWAKFQDEWAKKDWMAGIEPLPPGMAAGTAAVGMVTGLVLTSLVYGDYYQRRAMEDRMIVSGEHPSQQHDEPPVTTPPPVETVPVPDTVESAPAPAAPAAPAADVSDLGAPFVERFDRTDIADRWFISDGWSNGSWMANDWRKQAVEAGNGMMSLNLKPGPKGSAYEMMGGEARTHNFMRYGYFEVRMRVPRGAGTVSGVFSYADRAKGVKPNEIDIEILGKNTRAAELTIHEGGRATSRIVTLPFDASEGFHTYGFDWQPTYVRWYIDGLLAHQETGSAARNLVRPQQLILNMWGSRELSAWTGRLDRKQGPWKLEFSCVAYARTYAASLCD
ncbi:MAG: family 16 glycosylhydrolase [Hyphomonadaceae bacterium]